jgi:hypothetical protein
MVKELFEILDGNKDGLVTKPEFKQGKPSLLIQIIKKPI